MPSVQEIRRAIDLYLAEAYPNGVPKAIIEKYSPPEPFVPEDWLMSDVSERTPPDAGFDRVESFALRIGNDGYRNMKLRLTRPPDGGVFLFAVDSHDAFLEAPPGTPDHRALEELKRRNAAIAGATIGAWDAAGLPTERSYLRRRIRQARQCKGQSPRGPDKKKSDNVN